MTLDQGAVVAMVNAQRALERLLTAARAGELVLPEAIGDECETAEGQLSTALRAIGDGENRDPARCVGCRAFLSAVRVEMGLSRCWRCDGHGARRRGGS